MCPGLQVLYFPMYKSNGYKSTPFFEASSWCFTYLLRKTWVQNPYYFVTLYSSIEKKITLIEWHFSDRVVLKCATAIFRFSAKCLSRDANVRSPNFPNTKSCNFYCCTNQVFFFRQHFSTGGGWLVTGKSWMMSIF